MVKDMKEKYRRLHELSAIVRNEQQEAEFQQVSDEIQQYVDEVIREDKKKRGVE